MSDQPWIVWWWRIDHDYQHDIPVPLERRYDSLGEAVAEAKRGVDTGQIDWIKVFGPGGETDIRARWSAETDEWTDLSREAERVLGVFDGAR